METFGPEIEQRPSGHMTLRAGRLRDRGERQPVLRPGNRLLFRKAWPCTQGPTACFHEAISPET